MRSKTLMAINKLGKWRDVFMGWQLGTRSNRDPEGNAVRDHRELSIMLRMESSARTALLVEKGVFTAAEWDEAVYQEALKLDADYAKFFPGMVSTETGIVIEDGEKVADWMDERNWKP